MRTVLTSRSSPARLSLGGYSDNRLLAALPARELDRLKPHLQLVPMPLGLVLYEPGGQLDHVYFPTTSFVSRLSVTETMESTAVAIIGNEGMVGIISFMGGTSSTNQAVVQCAGFGYRMQATVLDQEFQRAGRLMHLLLHYVQATIAQIGQSAACNRCHSLEQHLCRWLLQSLDRLPTNKLNVTQKSIASIIGARRESVSEAASALQRAGVIQCKRGRIVVLDRHALEERVCECYAVVKNELSRLLPSPGSDPPNEMPPSKAEPSVATAQLPISRDE